MDRRGFAGGGGYLYYFIQVLMELILYLSKFLSQQLAFTYSLLNHRMKLRTALLQQVSRIAVAASTEGTHSAEIAEKCSTVYWSIIPHV